jgi:cytochrome P450
MSARVVSDLDPFSAEFRADPYAHYASLRALGPVVWLERYGVWALSHYETVRAALSDPATFSSAGGAGLVNHFNDPPWRPPSIILEVDPPAHTRTRRVLNSVLSRRAVQGLRGALAGHARVLIDAALNREEVEAVGAIVQPYVLTAFGDAVGLAAEDRHNLLAYGAMVFGGFGPDTEGRRAQMRDAEAVGAWIAARCQRPMLAARGFGAAIYAFADAGEITTQEAALLVRSLLSAGVDTTVDSIGLALRCLIEHPDQWLRLRNDPSLALAAFEEATRFDSSSQSLFRTTSRPVEFAGAAMGRHEKVMLFLGSAGRDPAAYDHPDIFDIGRRNIGQLGYGAGPHGCVAQTLARLEGRIFFETLARTVGDLRAAGPAAPRPQPGLRGLASLPVRLAASGRAGPAG